MTEKANKSKYIIPITLIICSIIISIGLISYQLIKQNSIEKQQLIKIEQENKIREEEKKAELLKNIRLNSCIAEAEDEYWDYMELNGTKKDDGSIWALNSTWDRAEKNKQNDIDICYEKYK